MVLYQAGRRKAVTRSSPRKRGNSTGMEEHELRYVSSQNRNSGLMQEHLLKSQERRKTKS